MMTAFYRWLCRFAYRRLVAIEGPDDAQWGIPGKRDSGNVCRYYSPHPMQVRRRQDGHPWDVAGCMTDGHALCVECFWKHSNDMIEEELNDA